MAYQKFSMSQQGLDKMRPALDAEQARVREKYGGAASDGLFTGATGGRDGFQAWEFRQNAEDSTQSNFERGAERRHNYYYGGSADYAGKQQDALRRSQGASGDRFSGAFREAGGRRADEFVDRDAIGDANTAGINQHNIYGGLRRAAEAPEGPSAAQAQLAGATSQNMQNQLSLARSGRGMGESAGGLRAAGRVCPIGFAT